MKKNIDLSPVTRLEGHLAIHTKTESIEANGSNYYKVTRAESVGEMFRGFEKILEGRDPLDAQQITQRICGVCPISHGIASCKAQEMAYGITPSHNGRILQNLVLAANFLQSNVLHFYQLAALDFVDVTAVLKYRGDNSTLRSIKKWVQSELKNNSVFPAAPFLPRFNVPYVKSDSTNWGLLNSYAASLDIRALAHEMVATFAGKAPHATAIIPGGVTQEVTIERILTYKSRLKKVHTFIKDVYIPDLFKVAKEFPHLLNEGKGVGNFLTYGVFEKSNNTDKYIEPGVLINGKWSKFDQKHIFEDTAHSWFSSESGKHPYESSTEAQYGKKGAYSWIKSPRYAGHSMEVGPLARILTSYHSPQKSWVKNKVNEFLRSSQLKPEQLVSTLGRHVARGIETLWVAEMASTWINELKIGEPQNNRFEIPHSGQGFGLTEAPRGTLVHWIVIENKKIKNYQCIVPTTWNFSPRDNRGKAGAAEEALRGTLIKDAKAPIEIARVVRSFDPCLACAVH